MESPKATIGKVFENFRGSLALEHRHTFESTELQDVWDAVQDTQTSQRKRHSAQNLRRIEPLLTGLNSYAAVVEVLCNGTPYLSFIWAPIKLTIQLASNHRDIFDALLDAYEDIGKALPRFDRYQDTFKNNPEFQYILAEVYSSIIEFHQRAYKFLQRRAWHLIFLSLWKDFRARFKGILNTLEKHRDFLDREANSIDMLEDREARSRMLEDIAERQRQTTAILESTEQNNRLAQFQNSITWLAADDKKQGSERSRKSMSRHSGTCEWIGRVPVMKKWLEDHSSEPVVWLNGKPGAGKSIMCTAIIDLLEARSSHDVCYYFCNNQDDGRDDPSERFLGVIATQLLKSHPEFASLITNEFISQGSSSSLARLRILVPKLLELQPHSRIIIDGIDECSKTGQKSLLKEVQNICLGPGLHSKVLISSRKEPHIKAELNKKSRISLDDNANVQDDIQLYVNHKIGQIQSNFVGELEPKIFNEIASSVAEKADGMFLWVKLITKELEECFCKRDLEECVKRLPHGLKDAYGRILDRLTDEDVPPRIRSLSIRILEWMSCSYRRLKSYELLDGVSIHPTCPYLDCDTKLQSRVLDLCRPLIEDGPSNTLVFVHFSAQEYILKAAYRQDTAFIGLEDAHMNIGFSCIAYLNSSFNLLPQNSSEEQRIRWVLQGLHGLQQYANQYWYAHLIEYLDLAVARKLEIPEHITKQMREILKYGKGGQMEESDEIFEAYTIEVNSKTNQLAALRRFPDLQRLISNLKGFQDGLKKSDWAQKSIDVVSEEICSSDPSWFSSTRYYYQLALEALLDPKRKADPAQQLQKFRETYSTMAFTCRYRHCISANSGFSSLHEREKHESQHRRQYRCDIPTCVDFEKGFATRGLLTKHNRKWHFQIEDEISLVEQIRALKKSKLAEEKTEPSQARLSAACEVTPTQQYGLSSADTLNGMNVGNAIRGPTLLEILTIRNHPSGKMITATDNEIHDLFIKKQLTQQQKQQQNRFRMLWVQMEKNSPDSQIHQDAKKKLFDLSKTLTMQLQTYRQNSLRLLGLKEQQDRACTDYVRQQQHGSSMTLPGLYQHPEEQENANKSAMELDQAQARTTQQAEVHNPGRPIAQGIEAHYENFVKMPPEDIESITLNAKTNEESIGMEEKEEGRDPFSTLSKLGENQLSTGWPSELDFFPELDFFQDGQSDAPVVPEQHISRQAPQQSNQTSMPLQQAIYRQYPFVPHSKAAQQTAIASMQEQLNAREGFTGFNWSAQKQIMAEQERENGQPRTEQHAQVDRHSRPGVSMSAAQHLEEHFDPMDGSEHEISLQENGMDGHLPSAISTASQSGISEVMLDIPKNLATSSASMWQHLTTGPPLMNSNPPINTTAGISRHDALSNGGPMSPQNLDQTPTVSHHQISQQLGKQSNQIFTPLQQKIGSYAPISSQQATTMAQQKDLIIQQANGHTQLDRRSSTMTRPVNLPKHLQQQQGQMEQVGIRPYLPEHLYGEAIVQNDRTNNKISSEPGYDPKKHKRLLHHQQLAMLEHKHYKRLQLARDKQWMDDGFYPMLEVATSELQAYEELHNVLDSVGKFGFDGPLDYLGKD